MAQTIKLRRGGLGKLATTTAAGISTAQGEVLLGTGSLASQLSGPILFAASENNTLQPVAGRIPVVTNGPALAATINTSGDENFADLTIHSGSKFYRYVDNSTGFSPLEVEAGDLSLQDAPIKVSTDLIVFISGSAEAQTRKESVADFVSAIAGTGLTAAAGVLSAGDGIVSASTSNPGAATELAIFEGANGIEGDANLKWDGTDLLIGSTKGVKFNSGPRINSATSDTLTIDADTKAQIVSPSVEIGNIGDTTATTVSIGNSNDTADINLQGTVNVKSATVATDQTTFNLVNTTATTVNFAGAATTLDIGASTGIATIKNATINLGESATDQVNVKGNLNVAGDLTYVSSETVQINDNIIELNADSDVVSTAGITVLDGAATSSLLWDVTNEWWEAGSGGVGGTSNTYRIAEFYDNDGLATTGQLAMVDADGRITGSSIVEAGGNITFNSNVDFSNIAVTFGDSATLIDGGTF